MQNVGQRRFQRDAVQVRHVDELIHRNVLFLERSLVDHDVDPCPTAQILDDLAEGRIPEVQAELHDHPALDLLLFLILGFEVDQLDFFATPGRLPAFGIKFEWSLPVDNGALILGSIQCVDDDVFPTFFDIGELRVVPSHVSDGHGGRGLGVIRIQLVGPGGVSLGFSVLGLFVSRVVQLHLLGDLSLLVLLSLGLLLADLIERLPVCPSGCFEILLCLELFEVLQPIFHRPAQEGDFLRFQLRALERFQVIFQELNGPIGLASLEALNRFPLNAQALIAQLLELYLLQGLNLLGIGFLKRGPLRLARGVTDAHRSRSRVARSALECRLRHARLHLRQLQQLPQLGLFVRRQKQHVHLLEDVPGQGVILSLIRFQARFIGTAGR